MKRKLITLEIYADDKNIKDSEECIQDFLGEMQYHCFVLDGTLELKIRENHIEMYKQYKQINRLQGAE